MLKGYGIDTIRFPDYLPLRYQRFILEKRKSDDEIDKWQHRLTNKFTNNFFRLMGVSFGIEVVSFPENGNVTELKISDIISFDNEFLQKLYILGYSSTINDTMNQIKKL